LYDDAYMREKLESVLTVKNVILEHLYHKPTLSVDEIFAQLVEWRDAIKPYVADTVSYLYKAVQEVKMILLEGQLGSLKDPDFGIYPFTTSSSTLAGYGAVGAGLPPYEIKDIIAVTKAYSSAVGAGDFVSEIFGDQADELRRLGGDAGEFGATTGRPRRMGWFDCVATRYGCRVQGATQVVLTAIDVLSYLDEIPVCVGYEIDGQVTKSFPATVDLNRAKPVFETLPGWKKDVRGITDFRKLPEATQKYVLFIEKELGVPIKMVSNGPRREEIIYR
ncbi:MAG: adenylosuccinate synthetase, partial [Clostridiaceae bacterium]|nr:adenylosuccinate synthetase [Clostridiaceae bacterium]